MERSIVRVETSKQMREGGGFLVRRPIGGSIPDCDPFLLLDHLGPVVYSPGEAVGAPDHPHRGFETVSYIIDGGMQHKDSAGNCGNLLPGWVQWMTAGAGVVHSEMPTDELYKKGGKMEGFQLWVNLPAKDKMVPPRYQDTPPERIPVVKTPDGKTSIKVVAGECLGTHATIETRTPILFLDAHVTPGGSVTIDIPADYNAFVYVWRGAGFLGQEEVPAKLGQVAMLSDKGTKFTMSSKSNDLHVLVIAGEPIKEPIVRHGPFVMNTRAEIEQAFEDYRSGRLGSIAGSQERYAMTNSAVTAQKKSGSWNKRL